MIEVFCALHMLLPLVWQFMQKPENQNDNTMEIEYLDVFFRHFMFVCSLCSFP